MAADFAEMDSLSSKNKNAKYFLCVIDVITKYAWVKPLKDKKGKTVLNAYIKIVNKSNHKPTTTSFWQHSFIPKTMEDKKKQMLDSERAFKIKVRSRWTVFEILLTSAVICI